MMRRKSSLNSLMLNIASIRLHRWAQVKLHPRHEQKDRAENRIGEDAGSIPIVLTPAITLNKIYVLGKTCLTGIIDEIIVLYYARTGYINVEAVRVILDGVELNDIPCIHDVDAELAAITNPVSYDGIEGGSPETYSSGAVVDDIV